MNPIRAIVRAASILTGLAAGLLALATAGLARPGPPSVTRMEPVTSRPPPPGWNKHPPLPAHAHTIAAGGMPGWQITVLTAAAALLMAAIAMTIYRVRAARQRPAAAA